MAIEHIGRLVIQDDTQANVEALVGGLTELFFGHDTDTGAIGYSIDAGATWSWLPVTAGATFDDAEGDPVDVSTSAAADGTSTYAARRDHRHHMGAPAVSGGAILQDEDGNILYDDDGSILMEELTIS